MYAKLIQEKKTSWGGRVLSARFPAHGSVSFAGSVLGGSRAAGSEELAKLHAHMLLEGTKKRDKKQIQDLLDSWGATLSFSITNDRLLFSGRVRAANLEKLLKLLAETLAEPAFPSKELAVLKKRELAALALEAQDTHQQALIALTEELFPDGHPNRMEATAKAKETLATVTSAALKRYHERTLSRRSLIISFAGDIAPATVASLAERIFKKLPESGFALPAFAPASPENRVAKTAPIAHKASIDYAVGIATGMTAEHPDYAPLLLGLTVLGYRGGFNGRLMSIVREKEGLTYGVYAFLAGANHDTDGYAYVWGTFAPQLFGKGRTSVMREIRRIVEEGITSAEAKKYGELYDAAWRVRLSNSWALARAAHDAAAAGQGMSYLDLFPKKVREQKAADVNRALKQYFPPERLSEAAAGPVETDALA